MEGDGGCSSVVELTQSINITRHAKGGVACRGDWGMDKYVQTSHLHQNASKRRLAVIKS